MPKGNYISFYPREKGRVYPLNALPNTSPSLPHGSLLIFRLNLPRPMGSHQRYAHYNSLILSTDQPQQSHPTAYLGSTRSLYRVGNVPRHILPPFSQSVSKHRVSTCDTGDLHRRANHFNKSCGIPCRVSRQRENTGSSCASMP